MIATNNTTVSLKGAFFFATIFIIVSAVNTAFKIVTPEVADTGIYTTPAMMALAIVGGVMAMANFQLAIVMFIFVSPLVMYTLPGVPFFFTFGDAFLLILILIFIMRMSAGKERQATKTSLDRSIFIFILFSLCSLLKSRELGDGIKEIVQTVEYFVGCYYLFSFAVSERKFLIVILDAILLVGTIISLMGFFEYISNGGGSYRIISTFGHFNANGTFLAMTTALAFSMAFFSGADRKTRTLRFISMGINATALLLTFSRGAWIGATVALMVATQLRGMVSFMKAFSIAFVAIILVSLFVPSNRYTERFKSISDTNESSTKNRIEQYGIAYSAMINFPLLGVGVSNSKYYASEKFGQPWNGEIHNTYLHIGAERGIPSFLVLAWIFIHSFRILYIRTIQTKSPYFNSLYIAYMSVLFAYGIANMFAYMLVRGPAMYFAMFLGLYQATIFIEDHEYKEVEWAQLLSTIDLKRPTMRMGA